MSLKPGEVSKADLATEMVNDTLSPTSGKCNRALSLEVGDNLVRCAESNVIA